MFHLTRKIARNQVSSILEEYKTDEKVLDVGASSVSYRDLFPNKISINIDKESEPDIVADAHDLPFEDDSFKVVICTEVLEHVENPFVVISELCRVLKKEGTLVLTTRFMFPLHETPHDNWRFTYYGLRRLFEDTKWDLIKLEPDTAGFTTFGVLLQRMAYQMKFRFFLDKPIKIMLFLSAQVCRGCNFLIKEEFGDIRKTSKEKDIFASGYLVVAKKKA